MMITGRIATTPKFLARYFLNGMGDFMASLYDNEFMVADDLHGNGGRLDIAEGIEADFTLKSVEVAN